MRKRAEYLQRGFTLIEVMIALTIGSVVMMGMLAMNSSSLKTQKYLSQKYAVLDFAALIRLSMTQPNFCSCNFPTAFNFSSAVIPVSTLNSVPLTACAPIAGVLASSVSPNNEVPGLSAGLKIQSIQMQNIHLINAISPASNLYSFDLQVEFDPAMTAYAIKPLVISSLTATTSVLAPSSEIISSCGSASGVLSISPPPLTVAQMCVALGGTFTAPSGPCALTAASGNSPPSGTVVGQCYEAGGYASCSGGASMPKNCPSGTVINNYTEVGSVIMFDCVTP